jgi:cytochrome c oxidase subunit 2
MKRGLPFLLPAGSANAHEWDWLFLALLLISLAVTVAIAAMIGYFAIRYRRGNDKVDRSGWARSTSWWEIGWSTATFLAFIAIFAWGADMYVRFHNPPANLLPIFVVGKQWMWKIQHPGGQREIDTLHLPLGQPVRLVLGSEDVIHSFHLPEFRLTQDAVPGRFTSLWFTPDKLGTFHIFCSEFCGTDHATMGGSVVVMTPTDYQAWLAGAVPDQPLSAQGEAIYRAHGCSGCHGGKAEGTAQAPSLAGLFGRDVPLDGGRTVHADERYLRDSILLPKSEIVAGYAPIMPSFQGQISEEELVTLIAYLEQLGGKPAAAAP